MLGKDPPNHYTSLVGRTETDIMKSFECIYISLEIIHSVNRQIHAENMCFEIEIPLIFTHTQIDVNIFQFTSAMNVMKRNQMHKTTFANTDPGFRKP